MESTSPSPALHRRVLIIGGGIGGLCLAQGLKKHGILFTVFERDASPSSRTQGYRLRINHRGFTALETCLPDDILELFTKSTATFVPGFTTIDAQSGEKAATSMGQGLPRDSDISRVFSADRLTLRSVLLTGLTHEELGYDMAFQGFNVLEKDGLVEAVFHNGERAVGGLLVGAEGAYSRVRRQYIPTAATLLDTDGRAIYGKTQLTDELVAALPSIALRNTTLVTSRDQLVSLFMEP